MPSLKKNFIRINGRNGGSFFFSIASFAAWRQSLEFYRAIVLTSRLKKLILSLAYPLWRCRNKLTSTQVAEAIAHELGLQSGLKLEENCSAIISPTKDKAIIHHHGFGYEKWAVGKSLPGVVCELKSYCTFMQKKPQHFCCSSLGENSISEQSVHFFMQYAEGDFSENIPKLQILLPALAEFFNIDGIRQSSWRNHWNKLLANDSELLAIVDSADLQGETRIGLAHRDFKPWNVKNGTKPLFFDFESIVFDGCPLEDLFNYTVDPLLHRKTPESVWRIVQIQTFRQAGSLLSLQKIPQCELMRYWRWYLLERVVFWRTHNREDFADKFLKLYDLSR